MTDLRRQTDVGSKGRRDEGVKKKEGADETGRVWKRRKEKLVSESEGRQLKV